MLKTPPPSSAGERTRRMVRVGLGRPAASVMGGPRAAPGARLRPVQVVLEALGAEHLLALVRLADEQALRPLALDQAQAALGAEHRRRRVQAVGGDPAA